jgi:competence protein ComEC
MLHFKNIPAFKFTMLLIPGIILGTILRASLPLLILTVLILSILCILILRKKQRTYLLIPVIVILFGMMKAHIDFYLISDSSVKYYPDTEKREFVILSGTVKELPVYAEDKIKIILKSELIVSGKDTTAVTGDVSVTLRENIFSKTPEEKPVINAGDKLALKGKLTEPAGIRNPGEFDYRKYLMINEIHKLFDVNGYENVKIISSENLDFIHQKIIFPSKKFALNNIEKYIKGDECAYLKGLVTGERNDISAEVKDAFINAGVMHLIAVSGLNVAYIILSLTLILSLFRVPLIPRVIIIIIFLLFYCVLTGSPSSIVRATIMGILILLSGIVQRKIEFYNIIGVSAAVILVYDSKQLFDAGFILSFSAVFSMVFIYNYFDNTFLKRITEAEFPFKKYITGILILFLTTLAAQIGTLPVTVNYFGKISLVSLISNSAVVPLANLSLATGFFQIAAGIFSGTLSGIIAETNNALLYFQLEFIKWCASLKFASISAQRFSHSGIAVYYISLIILFTAFTKEKIIKRVIAVVMLICLYFLMNFEFSRNLKVTFLDIGQGDCALIETPDNKTILVDCGMISRKYNSGERTIGPYLRRKGINKIDLIILTHLHADHIGGINYLLKNFETGKIITGGQKSESSFTDTMDSLILSKNIPQNVVRAGNKINEFKEIRLYFLFPVDQFVNKDGITRDGNLNNGSVAFILKYRDFEIFFSGDVEQEAENFICNSYSGFLKTDVLKTAHHGSLTSSTIPFILKNKPSVAVISCGINNKFNHPSEIILDRLLKSGAEIHRTDKEGAVLIESDGYNFSVTDWK